MGAVLYILNLSKNRIGRFYYFLPIFSLLFLFLTKIEARSEYWEKVTDLPGNVPKSAYWLDVFFLPSNPDYGWICGQYTNQVLRTIDGGNT